MNEEHYMTTSTPTSFIDSVRENLGANKVFVFCKVGTFPLEWPILEGGMPTVDDEDITVTPNGKVFKANKRSFRNIETSMVDDRGVGAQSKGYQELDIDSPIRVNGETDAEFLARIEDFIAKSGDPRIDQCGVRVEKGNPFPLPFANWDTLKDETLIDVVAAGYMGEDHETNLSTLKMFAGYELRRNEELGGPRKEVLEGLEFLATATGDESGDEGVYD